MEKRKINSDMDDPHNKVTNIFDYMEKVHKTCDSQCFNDPFLNYNLSTLLYSSIQGNNLIVYLNVNRMNSLNCIIKLLTNQYGSNFFWGNWVRDPDPDPQLDPGSESSKIKIYALPNAYREPSDQVNLCIQ